MVGAVERRWSRLTRMNAIKTVLFRPETALGRATPTDRPDRPSPAVLCPQHRAGNAPAARRAPRGPRAPVGCGAERSAQRDAAPLPRRFGALVSGLAHGRSRPSRRLAPTPLVTPVNTRSYGRRRCVAVVARDLARRLAVDRCELRRTPQLFDEQPDRGDHHHERERARSQRSAKCPVRVRCTQWSPAPRPASLSWWACGMPPHGYAPQHRHHPG
jgi:hypothetical protein